MVGGAAGVVIVRYQTPPAPIASFVPNVTSGIAPTTVHFYDSSDNGPTSWNWSAKNNTPGNDTWFVFNITSQNPVVTFGQGNWSISLNATNSAGSNISSQITNILVSPYQPYTAASFDYVVNGRDVTFTDTSTGDAPLGWTWFFGDENYTQGWVQKTANAGWKARYGQSAVVLSNGHIIVMGGTIEGTTNYNDTWRSTDNGATWTMVNGSSGWSQRYYSSAVAMYDDSIIITGGVTSGSTLLNDVCGHF
jgi:PKD repeat protein